MTLIATAISRHGIVLAADPALTSRIDRSAVSPRIFRLDFLNAAMSVTGPYQVAGEPMDRWMAKAVEEYKRTSRQPSLGAFVEHLRRGLSRLSDPIRRRSIHVAGYVGDGELAHPEVYYLRNIHGRAPDGSYGRPGREFIVNEEFWNVDYPRQETQETLREGGARMYLDGIPEKRIAYMLLHQWTHDFYRQVWSRSTMFHSPRSLGDIAALVELDLRIAATFLGGRDRSSRHAGEGLEIELIPAPSAADA
jgi:hypothetical protein